MAKKGDYFGMGRLISLIFAGLLYAALTPKATEKDEDEERYEDEEDEEKQVVKPKVEVTSVLDDEMADKVSEIEELIYYYYSSIWWTIHWIYL